MPSLPRKPQRTPTSQKLVHGSAAPSPLAGTAPRVRARAARRHTADRRAQLVELGLTHFGTSPYDDVSIDAIAHAAGISKGLLYHYFPTKRAFYAACVKESAEQFIAFIEPPRDVPPLDRLTRALDAYLTFVSARGTAFTTLMRSGVGVDEEIARIVDGARTACLDLLTQGFEPISAAIVPGEGSASPLASPLVRIALRGWIGFAEALSIAWVEAVATHDPREGATPPSQATVRDLLANALVQIVTNAFAAKPYPSTPRPAT